jgi:hypothetical protein
MNKFLIFLLLLLPSLASAQLKIKNGTDYAFKEVQMNYEEHSTGNLLEKYNRNKPLEVGQTLTLPNCNTFGSGDPLEFNISAKDADDDVYVFGEVDICKTREVVFTMEHLIVENDDEATDNAQSETNAAHNQILYDDFVTFANGDFAAALKSGMMSKVKPFLSESVLDGSGVNITDATGFTPALLLKAKNWANAAELKLTPRAPFGSVEFAARLVPVAFVGEHLGDGEETKGLFFVFGKQEDDTWKVDSILDYDNFVSYSAAMEHGGEEGDGNGDQTTDEDARALHQQEYEEFQTWLTETCIPLIKANNFAGFKALLDEGVPMTRPEFTKLATLVGKRSTPEVQPNVDMDLLKEIKPVVFLGINYNEDNQDGFTFVFKRNASGDWVIEEFGQGNQGD